RILAEMESNVVDNIGIAQEKVARTVRLMREAFEEAEVDAGEIAALEPAMQNSAEDRHVLAAAVAADCELIVTFNLRDFPADACSPVLVEVVHPDQFLLDLYDLDRDTVYRVVAELAVQLSNPPVTFDELLERLERAGVPGFAEAI